MLDYGEFVPEALLVSEDSDLLALGQKLDLFELDTAEDVHGVALYAEMIDAIVARTHAIVETNSFLK